MSMTVTWTLGEILAKLRKDAGMDQLSMAKRVGIARNTLSNYETDKNIPPFDVVVRWAAVTGASLDWLASVCTPSDLNREPTD
ncbi:helix-turn-helix domain-containing protein, partial [Microbacterium maritypicum]